MIETLIIQPIFNILTFILAIIPGHNFGVAIILFTVLARFALYPLLKKQLRHTKAMRDLQPEIKKIKEKTKGNRQQQSLMTMELYKEREIKPMSFIGLLFIQLGLFLALFAVLRRIIDDPQTIYDFSYGFIQNLPYMQEINADPTVFDNTLLGVVDLSRAAYTADTGFYFPAFLLVLGSALIQFVQIKQTQPSEKNSRKLRDILKDAQTGKEADSAEINAAMGRNMAFVLPIIIFVVTVGFASALSLYWFTGGLIAYLQQRYLLKQDEYAMTGNASVVSKKPLKDKGSEVKVSTYKAGSSKKKSTSQKPANKKKSTSKKTKKKR